MAEKKVKAIVKLQLPAAKATPGPPVGSTLGPHGINIAAFTKEFNDKTADKAGLVIPVVVTIMEDRSFTFVLKTPPAAVLIKKACGIDKASATPNKTKPPNSASSFTIMLKANKKIIFKIAMWHI